MFHLKFTGGTGVLYKHPLPLDMQTTIKGGRFENESI